MFEHLGYFEEILDKETGHCYGTRRIEKPSGTGYENRQERTFKRGEIVHFDKAHRGIVPFRFPRDIACYVIAYPLCGRLLVPITLVHQK